LSVGAADFFMASRTSRIIIVIVAAALLAAFAIFSRKANRLGKNNGAAAGSQFLATAATGTNGSPTAIAGIDLAAKLDVVEKATDPLQREDLIEAFIAGVPLEKTTEVLDFLLGKEATATNREIQLRLLRRMAEKTPKAAAEYAALKLTGKHRQDTLKNIAGVWAERDSTEAIAWARSLPEEDRNLTFVGIAYSMIEKEPMKALDLARELPATDSRDELVNHISLNWAAKNPAQASEWAAQIPDKELRERIVKGIAATWGDTDPAAAANLALTALQPGRHQDDAVVGIVQRWVQNKPDDAAAWVTKFPEGTLRNTATEELVKLWADKNADEAGNWINTLPPGPSRDRAVSAYVGKIVSENPEVAALWAGKIADEGQRYLYLERIGQAWLATDAAGARAWISKSGLPETTKERLLAPKAP
jgi:hypothetical protein